MAGKKIRAFTFIISTLQQHCLESQAQRQSRDFRKTAEKVGSQREVPAQAHPPTNPYSFSLSHVLLEKQNMTRH